MGDADVIVVGGGAAGAAAARSLAERGRSVVLLERAAIGHAGASSGGPTRIFRLAYDHPAYVRMARAALGRWRALEDAAGESLLVTTGGVDVGSGAPRAAEALAAAGEPFAWASGAEVVERWPTLRLGDDERALVQEDAGICLAARTLAALARLCRASGVDVREGTTVSSVRSIDRGVEVVADGGALRADVVVVAAGAWTRGLLVDLALPLVPTLEQVTYLELEADGAFPAFIDWTPDGAATPYAVPDPTTPRHVKVALHASGPAIDADASSREPDPVRLERVLDHARSRYAPHRVLGTETCLYTMAPDEDFVLDRRGPIVVASPCSGHGFKFTPLLGELIADLATGMTPSLPLDRFRLDRF
ncbi:MAG: FAD-dependent oxidoreductase [Actinomycetota bacterium]